MFAMRGMSNSLATICALSHKFMIRLDTSNNALIRALLASDIKWYYVSNKTRLVVIAVCSLYAYAETEADHSV